ncbi:MAG TPA: biopolymer transporter ExbD [Planctomycetota bacterium]|nr:biopolymer transporter ExbD [Planctomycetota bacterium]
MSKRGGIKMVAAESAVAPNLVPMVDIMFLLLLFLMVGADMQQREREEVRLPIATSAKEENPNTDDTEASRQLCLNVYHTAENCSAYETAGLCTDKGHWCIGIKGIDYGEDKAAELKAYLEGEVLTDRQRRGLPDPEPGKPKPISELRVMIRADKAALYQFVQRAMNSCADAGIYRIELGAALPAPP